MYENITCDLCGSEKSFILHEKTDLLKLPPPLKIVRCSGCSLVYLNPRLRRNDYETFYDSNYYNSWDHLKIVKQKGKEYENKYNLIERHLDLRRKGKLLDIGCGTGDFLKIGKDRGWEVYGIELSKWAADYGRINFNLDIKNKNLEKVAGLWRFRFDVITLNHVLEHLPSPSGALKIISEILHEEGLILVEVPNEFDQLMFLIAGGLGRKWLYNRHKGPIIHHTFYFTKDSLIKMLEKSGFQTLFIRTLNDDMLIRSHIFGGQLVKKIFYKVGVFIGRGPVIEVLARKQK